MQARSVARGGGGEGGGPRQARCGRPAGAPGDHPAKRRAKAAPEPARRGCGFAVPPLVIIIIVLNFVLTIIKVEVLLNSCVIDFNLLDISILFRFIVSIIPLFKTKNFRFIN